MQLVKEKEIKKMSNGEPDISLVILCYQTGHKIHRFLSEVIDSLNTVTINWEIVLVGNYVAGKQDATPDVVREIASKDPRIRAVAKAKRGWMGWDARTGLEQCTGKTIGLIDGDEQMIPQDIAKAYRLLIGERADMVKTYRSKREDPWIRSINSYVYNLIYNLLFPGYLVFDVNSKPKFMTRSAFRAFQLTSEDWFLDAEMMIQARRHRLKLVEFPTVFHRAVNRKSFVRFSAIFEFIRNLMVARWREFFIKKERQSDVKPWQISVGQEAWVDEHAYKQVSSPKNE